MMKPQTARSPDGIADVVEELNPSWDGEVVAKHVPSARDSVHQSIPISPEQGPQLAWGQVAAA